MPKPATSWAPSSSELEAEVTRKLKVALGQLKIAHQMLRDQEDREEYFPTQVSARLEKLAAEVEAYATTVKRNI